MTITTNPEIFAGICALRVTVTGSGFSPNTFVVGEFIRSDGTIVDEPHFGEGTNAMGNLNSYFFFYEYFATPAGTYTMRFFEDIIQNHEFDSHAETIAVIPTTTLTVPPICLPPLVFKNQGECVSTVEATYHGGKIYPEELEYYKEVCKQGEVGWAQVATFIAQVCRPGECGLPS